MTWEWLGAIGSILAGIVAVGAWINSSLDKKLDNTITAENRIGAIEKQIEVLESKVNGQYPQIEKELKEVKELLKDVSDKLYEHIKDNR